MKTIALILSACCILGLMAGCQNSQGSKTYRSTDAQRAMHVSYGTVLTVADVYIEKEQSPVGTIVGAVVGGVVGSTIGDGDGRKLATAGGALAGAAIGSAAEKGIGTKNGLELEVELDSGEILIIVQEKDDVFIPGERVRVIDSGYGRLRVRH